MSDDMNQGTQELQDYYNTYINLYAVLGEGRSSRNMRKAFSKSKIETVHEYLERTSRKHTGAGDMWAQEFKADMERFSDRVRRMNELAVLANKCKSLKNLEKIVQEVHDLIYGKGPLSV